MRLLDDGRVPRARRSRETSVCSAPTGSAGGSSPHTASTSVGTGDDVAGVDREPGDQPAQPRPGDVDRDAPCTDHLELAEDPHLHDRRVCQTNRSAPGFAPAARMRAVSSRPYCVNVPLRWSDMDAYGHVNNVQFLRLLEDARVTGFKEWFGQERSLLDEGVLVARHEIEYIAPLTFRHAPIAVEMWVTKMGGAGFDIGYDVRDPEEVGTGHYARAETSLVVYDFAESRPRRMRPDEKEILGGLRGEPVPFRWRGR